MKSIWAKSSCLPPCLVSTKKFSVWVYWKVFCRFWPIKLYNLSHMVSVTLIFLGIFSIIPFMVWLDSSQIKGRGYTFKSRVVCKRLAQVILFSIQSKYLVFHFLDLGGTIWIWSSWKLTKTVEISIIFKSFYFTPCMSWILVQMYQSLI